MSVFVIVYLSVCSVFCPSQSWVEGCSVSVSGAEHRTGCSCQQDSARVAFTISQVKALRALNDGARVFDVKLGAKTIGSSFLSVDELFAPARRVRAEVIE